MASHRQHMQEVAGAGPEIWFGASLLISNKFQWRLVTFQRIHLLKLEVVQVPVSSRKGQASSVGLVPKAQAGKFCMIQHLSYPDGTSINDGIDRDHFAVQYASFDEAVKTV